MKKLLSTTIAVSIIATITGAPVMAAVDASATPVLMSADSKTNVGISYGTYDDGALKMNLEIQGGQNSIGEAHWNSFNIGSNAGVNVEFTNHNQTSLNYVDGANQSQIFGKFTNICGSSCGYDATGKVILINPNGVVFGNGANVNLNSFTVSTLGNGSYTQPDNSAAGTLSLGATTKDNVGIAVENGATIYGDKNVAFASDNIKIYKGSQISTNTTALNIDVDRDGVKDLAVGKIKLITSDGVNFKYYDSGLVEAVTDVQSSSNPMMLYIGGALTSGHIEAHNASTHANSRISTNEAVLTTYKTDEITKADALWQGSDGNIWLKSNNDILSGNSQFATRNATDTAASREGGDLYISAEKHTQLTNNTANVVGDITIKSKNADVIVNEGSNITGKNVTMNAKNIASLLDNSSLNGNNILITAENEAQVENARANGKNVTINGGNIVFDNADIVATDKITARSTTESVNSINNSSFNAPDITFDSATDVVGSYNLNNKPTKIYAKNNIDVTLANVGERNSGLIAEADKNLSVKTPGVLSISRLVAKDGNLTIDANDVIVGQPINSLYPEEKFADTPEDRALIWVANGKFTTSPNMEVTKSGGMELVDTEDSSKVYQLKHNIQFGANGEEKVLLINPRLKTAQPQPQVKPQPKAETRSIAETFTRIPRTLEVYNNSVNIADDRSNFVDVFAAASQIELEDDDEY